MSEEHPHPEPVRHMSIGAMRVAASTSPVASSSVKELDCTTDTSTISKTESEDSDEAVEEELSSLKATPMLSNDFRISRHLDRFQIQAKMDEIRQGEKPLIEKTSDFVLETGEPSVKVNEIRLFFIDQERHTPYYEYYFHGKDHVNYLGFEKSGDPILVSLERKDKKDIDLELDPTPVVRALIRTCKPPTLVYEDEWVLIPATTKSFKKALATARPALFTGMKLVEIAHPELEKELLKIEKQLVATQFKFGVLNFLPGQTDDNSMFRSNSMSPDFEEFLDFLGDRVTLKGWDKFRGGLDVKTNTTGETSVYTKINNFQIMFHVSVLLPFFPNDEQQVERKRHLGNDVVVFVFKETDSPFNPSWIKSEFNHIFIVVQLDHKEGDKTFYKVQIASKDGVHSYEPTLPYPAVFEKNDRFKDFILTKAINSERAAMYAPSFVKAMARTRKELLRNIASRFAPSSLKESGKRKGFFHRLTGKE
eukprot:TRINITY_DN3415_c0_g2_i1.p1 TRINITY_DN3415_c0_g2~~TRINITY_DN3415_c0_g2_i1.p1  ORF type:complete len:478 (-),score=87.64 TRINITY_DN3415_c0_g2_i1:136-1569(-)